jgi:hypothetical protein
MKRALKDRINAAPDWHAEVEHAHPERAWIADVMAVHASGKRLAFEVQLSPQSEEEYIRRSQRYADDRIGAVWIVPDNLDWFRVQLPMIVTSFGKTSDLPSAPGSLIAPGPLPTDIRQDGTRGGCSGRGPRSGLPLALWNAKAPVGRDRQAGANEGKGSG